MSNREIAERAAREIRELIICEDCKTRGIPGTSRFNWPLCDACLIDVSRASAIILWAIEESQGQQEPSAPHPASLTALRKWEEAAGGCASASEGNAFIDGFNAGFEHRLETEYQRGRSEARDELSGADTQELREAGIFPKAAKECDWRIVPEFLGKVANDEQVQDEGYPSWEEIEAILLAAERVLAQGEPKH